MATCDEIAAKLATLGLGTVGATIKVGSLPATPDVCCAVRGYGGPPPEMGLGSATIQREFPSVQVLFRGGPHDYAAPQAAAQSAYENLAGVQAETLSAGADGTSAFYHWIAPSPPVELKRDERERVVFVVNLQIEKELSA